MNETQALNSLGEEGRFTRKAAGAVLIVRGAAIIAQDLRILPNGETVGFYIRDARGAVRGELREELVDVDAIHTQIAGIGWPQEGAPEYDDPFIPGYDDMTREEYEDGHYDPADAAEAVDQSISDLRGIASLAYGGCDAQEGSAIVEIAQHIAANLYKARDGLRAAS